jgi:hypothetical protein
MEEHSTHRWFVVIAVAAMTLLPAATVAGVLIGAKGPDSEHTLAPPAAAVTRPSVGSQAVQGAPDIVDRTLDMLGPHQTMMDQMRVSVSEAMNDLMNRDPMWQMMRSGTFLAALEQHEQDIDRMLARGG